MNYYERPFFFAGSARALWRGVRGRASTWLVKPFERVPHDLLLCQGAKYRYNLWLLRLSLALYRLAKTVMVVGCHAAPVYPLRGSLLGPSSPPSRAGCCSRSASIRLFF